jgi:hypothetical protein
LQKISLKTCTYAFSVNRNVAIQTMDHLIDVLKRGIPDSKIVQDLHLKRTKFTLLIKEVLGKYENNVLVAF